MCVMVLSSAARLSSILNKLRALEVTHLYYFNTEASNAFGMPLMSLVPFANLFICEDGVLEAPDFRKGMLLREASRMDVPVVSETGLEAMLAN